MLRILNATVLAIFFIFGIVFGVVAYDDSMARAQKNAEYQNQLNQNLRDITKEIYDDIAITQGNKSTNRNEGVAPSPGGKAPENVSFNSFSEMISYATAKVNNSTYLATNAMGNANIVKGSAMGVPLDGAVFPLTMLKAKAGNQRYYNFGLKVQFPPINQNIEVIHYTSGTIYSVFDLLNGPRDFSEQQYVENNQWNMTAPFHIADSSILTRIPEENIVAFSYDNNKDEYYAKFTVNTNNNYSSNFGAMFSSLTGSPTQPNYLSLEIETVVDGKGNFKHIKYNEHIITKFVFDTGAASVSIDAEIKLSYTEYFSVLDNGNVIINKPTWGK